MSYLSQGPYNYNRFAALDELRQREMQYFTEKAKAKKKLDPVGKEDADVDNDGDVDSSDSYLKKRREAIGKAMGKKGDKKEMKEGKCSEGCDCDDCKKSKKKEMKEQTIEEKVMDYFIEHGFVNNTVSAEVLLHNASEDWLNTIANEITEGYGKKKKKA